MASVLVATDGSELAAAAARRAVELLSSGHSWCVLSVATPVPLASPGAGGGVDPLAAPLPDPDLQREELESAATEARYAVDRTLAVLGDLGAEGVARVEHGDPGATICRVAEEDQVDLIALGSHGAGMVRRVLVGSVSSYVVHHAPSPVLVLRGLTTE